ncbi:TPA: TetR/AcrR family transcriptional regulator [Streptococcus agalactiae]
MDKKIRIPSQKRSINKSQKILETARQLFSQKNYFDVTTNEIAKKSSVSIGTLYSYFSNKEDILVALLKDYNNSFIKIFDDISTEKFVALFQVNQRDWLEKLIDKLLQNEDADFHTQIEMLSYTIPEAKNTLEQHHYKIKELTYQCLLSYTQQEDNKELKMLSEIMFNFISSIADNLLYTKHTTIEQEELKNSSIDCILLIIQEYLNKK